MPSGSQSLCKVATSCRAVKTFFLMCLAQAHSMAFAQVATESQTSAKSLPASQIVACLSDGLLAAHVLVMLPASC